MKKLICLLLAVLMVMSLAACGATNQLTDALSSALNEAASEIKDAVPDDDADSNGSGDYDSSITIDEQTLFTDGNAEVIVTGVEYDEYYGPEISVQIENKSDKKLTFSSQECYINDYAVYASLYTDVDAGKKAVDEITFSSSDMALAGITSIEKIEFSFRAYDEDYEDLVDSGLVEIKTSKSDSFKAPAAPEGTSLFNKDGIELVVVKYAKDGVDEYYAEPTLVMYAKNTTDKKLTISSDDLYVNGFKVDATYYETLDPGKCSVSTIIFYEEYLEKSKIEKDAIEEFELNFKVYDSDTYDTITKIEKAVYKP